MCSVLMIVVVADWLTDHQEGTTDDRAGLSSGSTVQEAAAGRPSCSRVAFLAVSHASRKRSSTRSFPRALPLAVAWCARASRSAASSGTLGPPCTRRGGKLAWRRLSGLAVQPGSPSACRATSRLLTTAWSPVNGCSRSVARRDVPPEAGSAGRAVHQEEARVVRDGREEGVVATLSLEAKVGPSRPRRTRAAAPPSIPAAT